MSPGTTSLLLTAVLAASPVELSLTAGVAVHVDPAQRLPSGPLPVPSLALTARVNDGLVLEANAGWYFIIWDAAALGGWSWRVVGERQVGTVIDLRALLGAHYLGKTAFLSSTPEGFAGGVAVAEVDLVSWGDPPGSMAFTAKLQAGAETSGFSVYPLARLTLGVAF